MYLKTPTIQYAAQNLGSLDNAFTRGHFGAKV